MDAEHITTDILDISEMFVSQVFSGGADERMALRRAVVKQVGLYLKTDFVGGYEASKRLLLQSWRDHYPAPAPFDESQSVLPSVLRYSQTGDFSKTFQLFDTSTDHRPSPLSPEGVLRSLTAYCAHYNQQGNFVQFDHSNYYLSRGLLTKRANLFNNKLLEQMAVHAIGLRNNSVSVDLIEVDNPQEHIFQVIAKAHLCRESLNDAFNEQHEYTVQAPPAPPPTCVDIEAPAYSLDVSAEALKTSPKGVTP